MKDIRQRLLATFEIEHRDHVEQIRALLGTPAAGPALEEMFRRAHSLKGAARAVDLHPIEGLAHRLETLFSRVRQGTYTLDREVSTVAQQVLDASEDCMAALAENRTAGSVAAALQAIDRVLGTETKSPVAEAPPPEPAPEMPSFQPLEMVKITSQNFDGLFRSATGMASESQRQDQVNEKLNRLVHDVAVLEKDSERLRRTPSAEFVERQVRSISRQVKALRRMHQRSAWTLRQFGRQLQQDIRQARMVPAESLVEGNRKMVRDLARDEAKEIEFRASSAGVHADRRVLNALKDPVMHLLRNAVIHGIEPPLERKKKGKPPAGLVTLRVDTNGQRLTIAVEDNGRGVDVERVTEVAVREGILPDAAPCSPQELTRILLRPGFSTAPAVTNLSGRGMGLSVVYEAVRRLQGDLDIQPLPGGGTTISLSVPLSISTHRLMLVSAGETIFALPMPGIERLHRLKVSSVESAEGKQVVMLDGQPVSLSSIHSLLGLEYTPARTDSEMLNVVVLRSGGQRTAVVVDAVLRETEAVIQDLGPASGCDGRISSGVVLDDDTIALVVNPMELIQSSLQSRVHLPSLALTQPAPPRPQPVAPSILVVDDSMTTRTLEKSILEAHGYRVRVAVDGMDALGRLHQEKADLVIADVEMPRLNGFGLIEAMKSDPSLAGIPVIIVTSLERREDQERGLSLGADAYIVKRRFDQEDLLTAIRQIL